MCDTICHLSVHSDKVVFLEWGDTDDDEVLECDYYALFSLGVSV